MLKMSVFLSSILNDYTKIHQFWFFSMHADMTAVTIQPNKIVLNEVKNNQALLEPSYRKKPNELFGQHNK